MSLIAGEALRAGGPLVDFFSHLAVIASKDNSSTRSRYRLLGYVKKQHQPLLVGTTSKFSAGITPAQFIVLFPIFGLDSA